MGCGVSWREPGSARPGAGGVPVHVHVMDAMVYSSMHPSNPIGKTAQK